MICQQLAQLTSQAKLLKHDIEYLMALIQIIRPFTKKQLQYLEMDINNEDKRIFALEFLRHLRTNPDTKIVATFDALAFGFFDAQFISRGASLNLYDIEQRLKTKKKIAVEEFTRIIRNIFMGISDYLLSDDLIQIRCEIALVQIDNFQQQFRYKFYQDNNISLTTRKQFKKQIEMVYYLKKYENNQGLLRELGDLCGILTENQEEYIFDLSSNCTWQQLIRRSITQ